MAVTYVRNAQGEFEKVGPGAATTDSTLSQLGKPADAAAVGVALSNKANKEYVDSSISYFSNPNLLINSDFRNPVNQRGQTSYTAVNRAYSIDRWNIGQGTLTVNNSSVTFTGNTTAGNLSRWFGQRFEHALSGLHRISFNCPVVSGEVVLVIRNNNNVANDLIYTITSGFNKFTINHASGSFDEIFFRMNTNNSFEIEWIKLEQGMTVTPFVPRLYDEELIICRRYFRRYKNQMLFPQFYSNQYYGMRFDIPMRAKPEAKNFSIVNKDDSTQSVGAKIEVDTEGVFKFWTIDSYAKNAILLKSLDVDAEIY